MHTIEQNTFLKEEELWKTGEITAFLLFPISSGISNLPYSSYLSKSGEDLAFLFDAGACSCVCGL